MDGVEVQPLHLFRMVHSLVSGWPRSVNSDWPLSSSRCTEASQQWMQPMWHQPMLAGGSRALYISQGQQDAQKMCQEAVLL